MRPATGRTGDTGAETRATAALTAAAITTSAEVYVNAQGFVGRSEAYVEGEASNVVELFTANGDYFTAGNDIADFAATAGGAVDAAGCHGLSNGSNWIASTGRSGSSQR